MKNLPMHRPTIISGGLLPGGLAGAAEGCVEGLGGPPGGLCGGGGFEGGPGR